MKKKPAISSPTKQARGYGQLIRAISAMNTEMMGRVATVANQALVLRNWMVGAYIVEFEQEGSDRAKYGTRLLERMAEDLKRKGLKGLNTRTLERCRLFYLIYPSCAAAIPATLSPEFRRLSSLIPGR